MRQLHAHTTQASLRSTAGTWGDVSIASTPEHVILDIHARNYDTAIRLRALLSAAIEAALDCEPRQPGLWSDATMRASAARRGAERRRYRPPHLTWTCDCKARCATCRPQPP
jgi:hypothetical protein